jgi:uncharacterized Rmd1/YagE family protein
MSEKIRIVAIAIKDSINLIHFAEGIGIRAFENWKGCLELDEQVISRLLKYTVEDAKVLLYKIGSLILIGLDENQERDILHKLELFLQIDYLKEMTVFNEYDYCLSAEATTKAEAMARSIRLKWIELQVDDLVEEAEPLLQKIRKGNSRGFTKKFCIFIAKIQRFQIETVGILAVIGRIDHGTSKEMYGMYLEEYNIKDRLSVVNQKLKMLQGITEAHELFGRFVGWQRLLILEAVLLVCFPIPGLLSLDIQALWQSVCRLINFL